MKKGALLNSRASAVIAQMGHTQQLVIGDCGLPIPAGVERIDLAVRLGMPAFSDVLYTVLEELAVEKVFLAAEIQTQNRGLYEELLAYFTERSIPVVLIPHEQFKVQTQGAQAVIRTGECHPYANIILQSGVTF